MTETGRRPCAPVTPSRDSALESATRRRLRRRLRNASTIGGSPGRNPDDHAQHPPCPHCEARPHGRLIRLMLRDHGDDASTREPSQRQDPTPETRTWTRARPTSMSLRPASTSSVTPTSWSPSRTANTPCADRTGLRPRSSPSQNCVPSSGGSTVHRGRCAVASCPTGDPSGSRRPRRATDAHCARRLHRRPVEHRHRRHRPTRRPQPRRRHRPRLTAPPHCRSVSGSARRPEPAPRL
jgi:hypothetical protein